MKKYFFFRIIHSLLVSILAVSLIGSVIYAQSPNGPEGTADFSGEWHTSYGPMRLRQNGSMVEGEYYPNFNGKLEGTVTGNILSFKYKEGWLSGYGQFTLSSDGNYFEGGWGSKRNPTTNPWTGNRLNPNPVVQKQSAPASFDKEEMRRMMEEAVKNAAQSKQSEAAQKPNITSDVDSPKYRNTENANNFALVVGVEKYSNNLPEAQFAERDAQTVKDHLVALGFPPRQVKLLNGNQATKANFEAYLEEWLPRNVKENSRVFVYYSGHGAPDPNSNQAYLVLYDGNPEFLGKTGYPIKKLYSQLNSLKAKEIVVALDSCFSGSGGRSVLAQGIKPLVTKVDEGVPATDKMAIFSASAGNEISGTMEDQGHGAFTYYFLKGLNGEAMDSSKQITVKSLYQYLKPKVQDAASLQNRDQTPQLMPASSSEQASIKLR